MWHLHLHHVTKLLIVAILHYVKVSHCPVHRAMADLNVVKDGDYEKFCNMVKVEVPQHSHLPKSDELQRLAMLSFTKPVRYWNAENAPVKGKRFNDYLMIANRTTELLKGG